jgi:glycosyltransferase involved in cell wall biosynthesis
MRALRVEKVSDLPLPPSGKTGWPWTAELEPAGEHLLGDLRWPCISVVTPSYNHGMFIEETIRSVLLQAYPNLEYFIMDGGSTDNTVEIIKKYEPWLTGWVSEQDRGQAHAVNKGWGRSQGPILAWLNSDDVYAPGAFRSVAQVWVQSEHPAMVYGDASVIDVRGEATRDKKEMQDYGLQDALLGKCMPQPAVFASQGLVEDIGGLDETLNYALDFEFFLRAWASVGQMQYLYVPRTLAASRVHNDTKCSTGREAFVRENVLVLLRIWKEHMQSYHSSSEWCGILAGALISEAIKAVRFGAYQLAWQAYGRALYWSPSTVAGYLLRFARHSLIPGT